MIHVTRNCITINGKKYPCKYAEIAFPGCSYIPSGYDGRIYNGTNNYFYGMGLMRVDQGTTWDLGEEILRNLRSLDAIQEHYERANTEIDPVAARRQSYPSTDELVVALWEFIVENNSDKLNEIQKLRLAIKDKYPKTDLGE